MLQTFERQAEPTGANIRQASEAIQRLIGRAERILEVQALNLENTSQDISELARNLDRQLGPAITSFHQAADSARRAFNTAETSFASANEMIGRESPLRHEVLTLLRNLSDAARSLNIMADYLERHPDALLKGKR